MSFCKNVDDQNDDDENENQNDFSHNIEVEDEMILVVQLLLPISDDKNVILCLSAA